MVNDLDINKIKLEPFRSFKKLAENPFKKCVFCIS
jgi:hypothetical protein